MPGPAAKVLADQNRDLDLVLVLDLDVVQVPGARLGKRRAPLRKRER